VDVGFLYELSASYLIVLAMTAVRIAGAFLVTPLFTDELVPPLIKNSIFVALGVVVTFVHPPVDIDAFSGAQLVALFTKEIFIGIALGFFFGFFLWAFESAGMVIDTQIGASMAMVYDPISGHQVTLYGDFIGRWVHYLFVAAGGFMFFIIAILESFIIWPLDEYLPDFRLASVALFEAEFGAFATLVVMIAAPVIVVILIVDFCLGLVNRFAKRLDIVFVSMAIKNLTGLLMVLILLPMIAHILYEQLDRHNAELLLILDQVLSTN